MFRTLSDRAASALAVSLTLFVALLQAPSVRAQEYERFNLVSDIPGVALRADAHLVNSWGIAFPPTGPVWINDNGTGFATVYFGDGAPFPNGDHPLVVTIPPPAGGTSPATPTGIVFNASNGFVVSGNGASGPSIFIFDTEDGTISGWSPAVDLTHGILVVDNSAPGGVDNSSLGAVYKGLAIGTSGAAEFIYAANFRDAVVEMYDSKFHFVKSFTDPNLPAGFAPFGIRNIDGQLFVTFAVQDAAKHDDVSGPGNGFVDIFDTEGNLVKRLASHGTLNSPWGLALAPNNFGQFSDALLVGNFGDGRINAFQLPGGNFLGQLHDEVGQPLTINGLWGLTFGNGKLAGKTNTLLFTAGIGDEAHGLFGTIRANEGGGGSLR
jgi:uncharacterized protein (TIGR03118 family)